MSRLLLLSLLALVGCERARRYAPEPAPPDRAAPEPARALPPELAWQDLGRVPPADTPIVFVHESADEWAKLPAYWNPPSKAGGPVLVKVPLGLSDPTGYLAPANPPTLAKWALGRRLFFDDSWLTDKPGVSCATCHDPNQGFSDGKARSAWQKNAPTLVNVVFARSLFWDGRATYPEEAVSRSLGDERAAGPHAWPGVIGRLRASKDYRQRFEKTFGDGIEPNQDALGQAIATYLRTLLAADSLFDRARKRGPGLEAARFEPLLDAAALKRLDREKAKPAEVAAELARGWELFQGTGRCAGCHLSADGAFNPGRFYNIGIDAGSERLWNEPGRAGRFAVAPPGERTRYSLGAWKTPPLRGLSRSGPYFHNGEEHDLRAAVRRHVGPEPAGLGRNYYLDPKLADDKGERRDFKLRDEDVSALTLLLRALDGEPADAAVASPEGGR